MRGGLGMRRRVREEEEHRPESAMPAGVKYLVWTEALQRFSVKGIQTVLALFMFEYLQLGENVSTELVHVFLTTLDMAPIVGAFVSDGYLGNYHTFLYFSFLEVAGAGLLILVAVLPGFGSGPGTRIFMLSSTALGLLCTAVGGGGLKPCITAFGGDQVEELVPRGADRERLRRLFFSHYYVAMNAGSFAATIATPAFRAFGSYLVIFSVQFAFIGAAALVFWLGGRHYIYRPVKENVYVKVVTIIVDAFRFRIPQRAPRIANSGGAGDDDRQGEQENLLFEDEIEGNHDSHTITSTNEAKYQWLDRAKLNHDAGAVDDVKVLLRVLLLFTAMPMFWSLFDQQFSKWVFQARSMNCKVHWLGGLVVEPDQMPALNPVLVLLMIPIFDRAIYPFAVKVNIPLPPLRKMVIGMVLGVLAFLTSGALQLAMDGTLRSTQTGGVAARMKYSESDVYLDHLLGNVNETPSSLQRLEALVDLQVAPTPAQFSVFWQLPQYILITAGEVLINITGLEFAYSQAPTSMKSVITSAWNCTAAIGNLMTFAIVAIIGDGLSKADEFFLFAGGCTAATFLMIWVSHGYKDRQITGSGHPDPMLAETTMTV